jgi:predicted PhzF superfamily epimerase YddE/YHI9
MIICAGPLARYHMTQQAIATDVRARGAVTFPRGTMQLQFQTVDVFTSERFAGNPLAVVFNAEAAHAEKRDGAVTAAFIGGRCVPVMSGTIDLA